MYAPARAPTPTAVEQTISHGILCLVTKETHKSRWFTLRFVSETRRVSGRVSDIHLTHTHHPSTSMYAPARAPTPTAVPRMARISAPWTFVSLNSRLENNGSRITKRRRESCRAKHHRKVASGTHRSKRWTCRVSIINVIVKQHLVHNSQSRGCCIWRVSDTHLGWLMR